MVSKLINKIVQKLVVDYCPLTIVRNQDGFLTNLIVRNLICQATDGCRVVFGTNLELRFNYEMYVRKNRCSSIFVCNSIETLVPDMKENAYITDFSISDVFPLFADKTLLRKQSFEVLNKLYDQVENRKVSLLEGRLLIESIKKKIDDEKLKSAEYLKGQLQAINIDWYKPLETISALSTIMVKAIKEDVYDGIAPEIDEINEKFQSWIDSEYFATLQSNPLLKSKSVNKVLPHLSGNYNKDKKIALFVVDGFSYWQYTVLKDFIGSFHVEDGTTLAWLPTITMLSRQALFRGGDPKQDYKQSPENEKRLWFDYWKNQGYNSFEVQYIYDTDEFAINEGVKRLAYVTAEMDHKMHLSSDYKDLYSLTYNWCHRIYFKIQAMINAGFAIYLTTDHGGVLSEGWRELTSVEKVFLYRDGSRGKRHLIYNNKEEQEKIFEDNPELPMIKHDNWLAIRNNKCFARENETMITHGGSHFMEMVIPLVKITN